MLKTKDKILLVALRQLNNKGLDGVSIRSIADELGISAGNLAYHFKNIDVIINALYMQLVEKLNQQVTEMMGTKRIDLAELLNQTNFTFKLMLEYKFLSLDFTAIMRRVPEISDHFKNLMAARKNQIHFLFDRWISEGTFMEEKVDGMYDKFFTTATIFFNSWIQDAQIQFNKTEGKTALYYSDVFINLIIPFLTKRGLEEYKQVMLS
jgi:AcrR family transcriptional regulator